MDQVRSDESRTPKYLKLETDPNLNGDPFKHKGGLGVVLVQFATMYAYISINFVKLTM